MAAMYKPVDVHTVDPFSLPSMPMADFKNLPEIGGVYFAIREPNVIAYIGETLNIRQRIKGHRIRKNLAGQPVRIAWLQVPDPELRSDAESRFINHYKPELNIKPGRALPRIEEIHARIAKYDAKIAECDPENPNESAHWISQRKRAILELVSINRRASEKRTMYAMLDAIVRLDTNEAYTLAIDLFRQLRVCRSCYFHDEYYTPKEDIWTKRWSVIFQCEGEVWMTVTSEGCSHEDGLGQRELDFIQSRGGRLSDYARNLERQLPERVEEEKRDEADYVAYLAQLQGETQ